MVNHSQAFRQEFFGKYIWCPKRKQNNQLNPFYETMREVAPGDVVFSFADGRLRGNSFDSHLCGFADRKQIGGKANRVLFSFDKNHHYVPRPGRTFASLD